MMQQGLLIKDELSPCMLPAPTTQQLGHLELQLCVKWGVVGGLWVSMYEVLMTQHLGDLENPVLKM